MTVTIAITGGIATGKSTVSKMIQELKFTVIDADMAARKVVEPNESAYKEIVEKFGKEILQPDKTIDRAKLGSIIFHDENKRKLLNSIVHPAVRKQMHEEIESAVQRGERAIFLDIPLLYESNLTHMAEKVIVVYVDQETQLERLMARNHLSKEDALARIQSQLSIEEKRKLANAVIDNRSTIAYTKQQLMNILTEWGIL
ncbi:dephospho-CoA kinase [Bacillus kwashiorkori]|uniref:dephospho-CoA kinase n=1 Tax=Bacillus kwashiorkori TaxID=1522318 RepID=UPI000782EF51|nr:dephospho-CoA kinase [Bacillus kwashiorkori]